MTTIGVLNPGEMGGALGACLRERGHDVRWAGKGRSEATRDRAAAAGLRDEGSVAALAAASDVLVSVCPPHAAVDVARAAAGFRGVYVDASAIAPATGEAVRAAIEDAGGRFVDGGIVGPPPDREGTTRLFLSGPDADDVAALFAGTRVEARVLGPEPGAASAL
jgi:3-hydroxyisobutyrate dehydrogenase-like beta-hydroxyacid dehydrogenase